MTETTRKPQGTGEPTMPEVNWDDSAMVTTYANVCNVMGTREEMMLLFGANQGWQNDQKQVNVRLSNRILMTPLAAKRLLTLLELGLREYENRYGPLQL